MLLVISHFGLFKIFIRCFTIFHIKSENYFIYFEIDLFLLIAIVR